MGICTSKKALEEKEVPLVDEPPVYEISPPPPPPPPEVEGVCIGCIREEALQKSLQKLRKLVDAYANQRAIKAALETDPFRKDIWIPESERPRVRQELVDLWNKDPDNITLELKVCKGKRKDETDYNYKALHAVLDDGFILTKKESM